MVHTKPSGKAYGSVEEVEAGGTLVPMLVPPFAVSLGALQIQFD
jgi:hypothetical protein